MYFNQNNYGATPYPSKSNPKATIKTGGCGVCCGSTVLALFGVNKQPPELAKIYIDRGARAETGTDMAKASTIICDLGKLACQKTNDEAVLTHYLKMGAIAIANVDGDEGEPGVFSSAGHYVVVVGIKSNGDYKIYDVADSPTRYSSEYRKKFVTREGMLLTCKPSTLHMDTKYRNPNYYLFTNQTVIDKIKIQEKCKFSDPVGVWEVLNQHKYATDMYKKWAASYQ